MKILIVNIAWIDNGWKELDNKTKSGHRYVRDGGIAHESVNFKFDAQWNTNDIYGFCQFTKQPSVEGNDNLVIFYSNNKIVGFYADVEFGKFEPENKPNEIRYFNMKAKKDLSFKLDNYLDFDSERYLPDDKQRIGQGGYTYTKKEQLINLLNDIISTNANLMYKIEDIMKKLDKDTDMNTWVIAPGEEASIWNDCKNNNYIAIGWDKINANDYNTIEDLKEALIAEYEDIDDNTRKHNYIWNFAKNIKQNDLIIARNGKTKIVGIGKVTSDYIAPTDSDNPREGKEYKQIRYVNWIDTSEYNISEKGEFAIQTVAKVEQNDKRIIQYVQKALFEKDLIEKINLLKFQKQIILQGPPGTGKTRLAKQIAIKIINDNLSINTNEDIKKSLSNINKEQIKLIQFHPSYSYEDFVRGIMAKSNNNQIEYKVENKILAQMAKKALENEDNPYILIIDEINRANLSSVLGELIYALEYRDEAVESMYDINGERAITLPSNLYIIGTMNTADRSIGHIDYAIRRRFAFKNILPEADKINSYEGKELFKKVEEIFNKYIVSVEFDKNKVMLGHSYFIADGTDELKDKLEYQVKPLLREYISDGVLNKAAKVEVEKL